VDLPPDDERRRGEKDHGKQREPGEPRVDPQHEPEREQATEDRARQVHDGRARRLPHGADVVRQPRHEIADAIPAIESGVEIREPGEQVVPEIVLDPAAQAVQHLAHAIAHPAGNQSDPNDRPRELKDPTNGRLGLHPIYRCPHEPGWNTGECGG
jgi:hypothetical protein